MATADDKLTIALNEFSQVKPKDSVSATHLASGKARVREAKTLLIPVTPSPPVISRLVDSIGVNTHSYYGGTAYSDWNMVKQRLSELGIKHVRETMVAPSDNAGVANSQQDKWLELAAMGIKVNAIMGDAGRTGHLQEMADLVKGKLKPAIASVEATNEFDLNGGSNWRSVLVTYQQQLWGLLGGAVPVVGMGAGNANNLGPDLSQWLDYGCIHSYPGGTDPTLNISRFLQNATAMSANKPVFSTETGYHNAVNMGPGGHRFATEAQTAIWMPQLFRAYYAAGIKRTFSYELVDQYPDPGRTDLEKNFGLFHSDWSYKPAAYAVQALIKAGN